MVFVASKLFWAIAAPGNLLLLLLLAGLVAALRSWQRRLRLVSVAALALLAVAALPLGVWLIRPLEQRFPVPELPAHIDGIIALGGAVDPDRSRNPGEVALNQAAARITETVVLARRHPEAKILLSGGDASILPRAGEEMEADATRRLMIELGVPAERILVEDRARNTYENAVDSRALAAPKPGEIWLLVTSAAHMPRAVGCFRKIGWDVLPYPVDFRSLPAPHYDFSLSAHLSVLEIAAKEWVGLAAYHLLDRTSTLFPGP
jgi:uncharacterized SAM-binding protein YcdF (DUF218 family)